MTDIENIASPAVGSIVRFADIDWRVLAVEGNKALLISENSLEDRPYNTIKFTYVIWETCSLRKYLNGEFYNSLGTDKSKIAETKNSNPDNQWYGTKGGSATTDKIFLLSLDEVVKYFGDSGQLTNRGERPKDEDNIYLWGVINDEYNSARIAINCKNGYNREWWLRTPGLSTIRATYVNHDGKIRICGNFSHSHYIFCGVRPALWLNL